MGSRMQSRGSFQTHLLSTSAVGYAPRSVTRARSRTDSANAVQSRSIAGGECQEAPRLSRTASFSVLRDSLSPYPSTLSRPGPMRSTGRARPSAPATWARAEVPLRCMPRTNNATRPEANNAEIEAQCCSPARSLARCRPYQAACGAGSGSASTSCHMASVRSGPKLASRKWVHASCHARPDLA